MAYFGDSFRLCLCFFFFQAEDGIRDLTVTGVQTCALPISSRILLPLVLGLSAAAYLFFTSFNKQAFANVHWSWNSSFWISMALLATVIRDEIGRASCRERV